jgi:hypothetical protein
VLEVRPHLAAPIGNRKAAHLPKVQNGALGYWPGAAQDRARIEQWKERG